MGARAGPAGRAAGRCARRAPGGSVLEIPARTVRSRVRARAATATLAGNRRLGQRPLRHWKDPGRGWRGPRVRSHADGAVGIGHGTGCRQGVGQGGYGPSIPSTQAATAIDP